MSRFVPWLLLVILFGTFATAVAYALLLRAEAGKDMPHYSVYSEEPDGLAATARFLRNHGWEPIALARPVQQLPPGDSKPRLLIMVEPQPGSGTPDQEGGIGKAEARAILRWVEEGNTLLLCGRHINGIHQELGVVISTDLQAAEDETARVVALGEAGAYTDGIDSLQVEGRDELQSGQGLPLWWLDGRPGALLFQRGRGRVLVVSDPSIVTRRGLGRVDNAVFLYKIAALHAGDDHIYFDEYHHGIRSGGGFWGYLHYHRQHWALVPILAAVAVAVWSVAVRLGPAASPPQAIQADAVDYASALARIYERAGTRHLLARTLTQDFIGSLTRHLGLRRSALPAEILAAWKKREEGTAAGDRLATLLRGVGELRQGTVPQRELLYWTRTFDRFMKEDLAA
jgi:hypothetical protein